MKSSKYNLSKKITKIEYCSKVKKRNTVKRKKKEKSLTRTVGTEEQVTGT